MTRRRTHYRPRGHYDHRGRSRYGHGRRGHRRSGHSGLWVLFWIVLFVVAAGNGLVTFSGK